MARRAGALVLAAVAIATSATPALGLLLWTLTAGPLTVTSGAATTFTLTASSLDLLAELGCLEVDLPSSFTIVGASAGNASNGDEWEAVIFPNKVAVHSLSGGGRLELGQSITFTITAIPTLAGTWTWPNHAHAREDCRGAEELGVDLAILVVPGPTPTPSPTPTPTPSPTQTPLLSLEPLPTVPPTEPLPSILPTVQPLPSIGLTTPAPTRAPSSPSASPVASPTSSPSPTPSAAASPAGAAASPPGDGQNGLAPGGLLEVGDTGASGQAGAPVTGVSLGPLGVIDGITVWAIPGAIVGGPGLLVILWVLAQTGVALAWIPAVRRLRGRDAGDPGPFSGPPRTVAT